MCLTCLHLPVLPRRLLRAVSANTLLSGNSPTTIHSQLRMATDTMSNHTKCAQLASVNFVVIRRYSARSGRSTAAVSDNTATVAAAVWSGAYVHASVDGAHTALQSADCGRRWWQRSGCCACALGLTASPFALQRTSSRRRPVQSPQSGASCAAIP